MDVCNVCRHPCIFYCWLDKCILKKDLMKRIFTAILSILVFALSMSAQSSDSDQTGNDKFPFSIKAYPFRGTYLDGGTHWEKFGGAYPAGVHLGFEFPSQMQRPWQQYLGRATVGAGLTWIDLGHKMLGHSIAIYPYILLDATPSSSMKSSGSSSKQKPHSSSQ